MSPDTNGVALIGRILAQVASGEPGTGAELASRLRAARSTAFEVLRQLEKAGFVDRDAAGRVSPGPTGADLGFAALGMGQGAAAAEALLPVLRDELDGGIELVVRREEGETTLVRRDPAACPEGDCASRVPAVTLEEPVVTAGPFGAVLRLTPRPGARAPDSTSMRECLKAVADALCRPPAPGIGEPGEP